MQFPPTGYPELVRILHGFNPKGYVVDEFTLEPFFEVAAGDKFSFTPGKGRIVHLESHAQGGLIHAQHGEWLNEIRMA